MKKIPIILITTIISFSALAQKTDVVHPVDGKQAQTRFVIPNVEITSIEKIKSLEDDTWINLEGYIIKQVGHELYEFRDKTGTINVNIDDKLWRGRTVKPSNKVQIEGKIDKERRDIEIDVKSIRSMN